MRFLLFLLPVVACAWAPQRPEQPPSPATQVNLNVVALDAKGQSVLDLSAADFHVWDNGEPQTISSFRRREPRASPPATLGPRQFSNRFANDIPHATVILFDLMNMQFSDRGYVANELVRSLQHFEFGDNLYLYLITTNGGLYPVHGLPGSGGEGTVKDDAWTRDIKAKLDEALRITLAKRPMEIYFDVDARVRTTFATLSVVAARLAGVPGRKNIVWLTHGVPISLSPNRSYTGEWIDYTPYIHQLSDTLDRAGVSIYAVQQSPPGSVNGLGADTGPVGVAPAGAGGVGASAGGATATTGMGSEETLDEFANLTGGRAYRNNDIAGAIKQAINDVKQSYVLTYAPPPGNWDGKYHKVRITCTRKGVRVQARQGYLAVAEKAASGKQADDAIEAAMLSSLDAAEIGLRGTATPLPGDPPALRVVVRIDLGDVRLTPDGDAFTGQLETRFIEYLDDGSMRQTKPASLNLHLTREQRDAAMNDGYSVTEDLAVSSHLEQIRAIVFDIGSAAIGSLSVPLRK